MCDQWRVRQPQGGTAQRDQCVRADCSGELMESSQMKSRLLRSSLDARGFFLRALSFASVCVLALSGCEDDRLGELQLKPICAELSSAYYGGMCEGAAGPDASIEKVRAVRIGTIAGDCAVLYLDGVDRKGEPVIYGAKTGDRPECAGLIRKLEVGRASAAVLGRAREICR